MYIPQAAAVTCGWIEQLAEYFARFLHVLKQLVPELLKWLCVVLNLFLPWISRASTQLSEWVREAFLVTLELVHNRVYFAHILAWSIFFGPIIILVPSLLIHELLIITAYNSTFLFHGLLSDNYEALRLSMSDIRESHFSFVDRSSAVFNEWTSKYPPLMVFRLTGAVLGTVLLYAIWVGW
ncbi:hypothetical protein AGABI2DRAFT_119686 [Agaricus bisporus var. bisporus H97]|uniref:hypothetical protein n=1 Tax=Agaricus bisporus var. bisporus (strain H97 / ATCC MYA-4626 / FGSC 10389) TaxID=936046 RepID=UPI00029F60A2|nr:hypothetical protein AGABI2DRAFT_119686 [Agaricus bisporus var. bisporus H97]EKV46028.1 hypothetical protein AGABI2DRAFT_119686 [Agaricus bisporus var. bisporus H97]